MKTKKEVIQEAWVSAVGIERYESIKDELVLDGFLHFQPSSLKDTDTKVIDGLPFYRPKSLAGIETNNGWIKIESEADLPKKDIDCFYIPKRSGEIVVGCFRLVSYKGWKKMFTVDHNIAVGFGHVTHYQPIIRPLPPIY